MEALAIQLNPVFFIEPHDHIIFMSYCSEKKYVFLIKRRVF